LGGQRFGACHVGRSRVGQSVEHAVRERVCQQALCLGGSRVERQRVLEHADPLRMGITRDRL
jgi:hypothetical protein